MNNLDLIKQYVDTGIRLPEYQVKKLNNNLSKTYIRKRLFSLGENNDPDTWLKSYEFILLPENIKNDWFNKMSKEMIIAFEDDPNDWFKYGSVSETFEELLYKIKPSDELDNFIIMALRNKSFYDSLNISTINVILTKTKNVSEIKNLIGDDKWKEFLNYYDTKRNIKSYFMFSYYPENTLKAFGPELLGEINKEDDESYLWTIISSPVPQKLFYMFPNRIKNMVNLLKDKNTTLYANITGNAKNKIELRKIFVDNNIPTDGIDKWLNI